MKISIADTQDRAVVERQCPSVPETLLDVEGRTGKQCDRGVAKVTVEETVEYIVRTANSDIATVGVNVRRFVQVRAKRDCRGICRTDGIGRVTVNRNLHITHRLVPKTVSHCIAEVVYLRLTSTEVVEPLSWIIGEGAVTVVFDLRAPVREFTELDNTDRIKIVSEDINRNQHCTFCACL